MSHTHTYVSDFLDGVDGARDVIAGRGKDETGVRSDGSLDSPHVSPVVRLDRHSNDPHVEERGRLVEGCVSSHRRDYFWLEIPVDSAQITIC